MSRLHQFVVFTLDEQRYALPLTVVERVFQAVQVTKLPESPESILGIVNIEGLVVPVIDLRKRFGLAAREMSPDDRMILADASGWRVALWVDTVPCLLERSTQEVTSSGRIFPGVERISGVAQMDGDIIQIYDLEQCLSTEEEKFLENALKEKDEGVE